jgi:large subunit ribosomal protein L24
VVTVFRNEGKLLVEGINLATKHKRQTRQDSKGGIIKIEAPMPISKVMLICKSCNKPARVGFVIAKDGAKERVCKKCQGVL